MVVPVQLAISDSATFEKDQFGLGAGNLVHFALAVKHVLFAPAFKIPWDYINFLPSQRNILSGKWYTLVYFLGSSNPVEVCVYLFRLLWFCDATLSISSGCSSKLILKLFLMKIW